MAVIVNSIPSSAAHFNVQIPLKKLTPGGSVVCGLITDNQTGHPIDNATVLLIWTDFDHYYSKTNVTSTDSNGFYTLNVNAGDIRLTISKEGYLEESTIWHTITENEIVWLNVTIFQIPPEDVHIYGFVSDSATNNKIPGVRVEIFWEDNSGHFLDNQTITNDSGFYLMNVWAGDIYFYCDVEKYFYYSTEFFAHEHTNYWLNLSLDPLPKETAIICGYITDNMNDDPIEHAYIDLNWYDPNYQNHYYWNSTYSTNSGFYSINVASGMAHLSFYAGGYSNQNTEYFYVADHETVWRNVSLTYAPQKTAICCGYATDKITSAAVKNAFVLLNWKDENGHFYCDSTRSQSSGYYSIEIPEGDAQLIIEANGYRSTSGPWNRVLQGKTLWLNTTLKPAINAKITKPLSGIYVHNIMILPTLTNIISKFLHLPTIIVGPIDIEVNVTGTSSVNRVDFFVNGMYKETDNIAPYSYTWSDKAPFSSAIKVIAYDNAGPCDIKEIAVKKIF